MLLCQPDGITHWNNEGHELAADLLLPVVVEQMLRQSVKYVHRHRVIHLVFLGIFVPLRLGFVILSEDENYVEWKKICAKHLTKIPRSKHSLTAHTDLVRRIDSGPFNGNDEEK